MIVRTEGGRPAAAFLRSQVVPGPGRLLSAEVVPIRSPRQGIEQRRIRQDLVTARRIQRSFLPELESMVEGFRVSAEYRPAYDVGGDFYDVFATGSGRLTAVIGDVSGQGVSAALVMARISSDIRRLAPSMESPRHLVEQLNEAFCPLGAEDVFVTMACLTLDATRRQITLCNAGHVLPFLRRASGAVFSIGAASGPPIGVFSDKLYHDESFDLEVGDVVLLMTDGITEALQTEGDYLGRDAITELINRSPASGAGINRSILSAIEAADAHKVDDLALLTLEVTPAALRAHFATAPPENAPPRIHAAAAGTRCEAGPPRGRAGGERRTSTAPDVAR